MRRALARPWRLLAAGLLGLGLWQVGLGLWIPAKAAMAQLLLHAAWARATAEAAPARPWPWADFTILARLTVDGRDYIIVSDAGGAGLAFAPSHVAGSAPPGTAGSTVIAAHRDTHFAGLDRLGVGAHLQLVDGAGAETSYAVVRTAVLEQPRLALPADGRHRLVLVTCWPLRGLAPDPARRFVVVAEAVPGQPVPDGI